MGQQAGGAHWTNQYRKASEQIDATKHVQERREWFFHPRIKASWFERTPFSALLQPLHVAAKGPVHGQCGQVSKARLKTCCAVCGRGSRSSSVAQLISLPGGGLLAILSQHTQHRRGSLGTQEGATESRRVDQDIELGEIRSPERQHGRALTTKVPLHTERMATE